MGAIGFMELFGEGSLSIVKNSDFNFNETLLGAHRQMKPRT